MEGRLGVHVNNMARISSARRRTAVGHFGTLSEKCAVVRQYGPPMAVTRIVLKLLRKSCNFVYYKDVARGSSMAVRRPSSDWPHVHDRSWAVNGRRRTAGYCLLADWQAMSLRRIFHKGLILKL